MSMCIVHNIRDFSIIGVDVESILPDEGGSTVFYLYNHQYTAPHVTNFISQMQWPSD